MELPGRAADRERYRGWDVQGMDEIVQEFLVESYENLDQLDRDLVALEQTPDSRDLLSSIFRTIHTIKGTSGFLAFGRLELVTHVGENLLSRLRDGELVMTPPITDALLRMVDTVRTLLASIESTGAEGDVDVDPVVAAVSACVDPAASPAQAGQSPAASASDHSAAEREVDAAAAAPAAAAPRRTRKPASKAAPAALPADAEQPTSGPVATEAKEESVDEPGPP